ncbi:hypothetical protein PAAG_05351 [Paracoccidioides lutzii Pb01]|uniref:Ubiquitin 3 binding protein But2 C-terminal domain-containing protein n=1 Tax=Paracoccidioides lutzii (strain ATCC MYA-826 / Pb01) TaxID=502779 RepID=C1H3K8_PARBA|nr:hypothetical protein PAAG_05351 [Paracoccidioides lutzii Pb01]EEH34302.1 hypothetical protein PAAG_05351 [Paracoccidioides lutzii Pb01]
MKLNTLLVSAAAAVLAAPSSSPAEGISARQNDLIYPHRTFRYWVQTGALKEDPQDQLLVVKNGVAADETTTIVTFEVSSDLEGRRCKLLFDLWPRDVSTGSKQADVFTVINPPTQDFSAETVSRWRPAALAETQRSRDIHQGRISVNVPGSAVWIQSFHGYPEFDCPAGKLFALEYVGVNDEVAIRWDIGVTGPRITPI